jgi:hypothetical protein
MLRTSFHADIHETSPLLVNLIANEPPAFVDGKYELVLATWVTGRSPSTQKRNTVLMRIQAVRTFNPNFPRIPINTGIFGHGTRLVDMVRFQVGNRAIPVAKSYARVSRSPRRAVVSGVSILYDSVLVNIFLHW